MIIITSKKEGFRRCGLPHPATPTEYPDDRFSEKELDALKKEPMLTVVEQPGEDKASEQPRKDKKAESK